MRPPDEARDRVRCAKRVALVEVEIEVANGGPLVDDARIALLRSPIYDLSLNLHYAIIEGSELVVPRERQDASERR
jgi:hypothetical protein